MSVANHTINLTHRSPLIPLELVQHALLLTILHTFFNYIPNIHVRDACCGSIESYTDCWGWSSGGQVRQA
jgi:hypothetical protein